LQSDAGVTRAALLLAMLLAIPATATTTSELSVGVSSHVMYAPGNVRITAYIQPDDKHRSLTIEADSTSFYRSSTMVLEGARAPRQHTVFYRGLPAGDYQIRATVANPSIPLATASQYLRVIQLQPDTK
jgi:hypothetical protein